MTRLSYIAQLEGIQAEDEAIELIARHVEGGLRDAIGLLEQMTIDNKLSAEHIKTHLGITGHQTINALIDLLVKKETVKALHTISGIHNEGYDLNTFVREILECLRDKLKIPHGTRYEICRSAHSEMNAIINAARAGVGF